MKFVYVLELKLNDHIARFENYLTDNPIAEGQKLTIDMNTIHWLCRFKLRVREVEHYTNTINHGVQQKDCSILHVDLIDSDIKKFKDKDFKQYLPHHGWTFSKIEE